MTVKTILVTGATGKQGKSLISALSSSTENSDTSSQSVANSFRILALTRNKNSPAAKLLSLEKHVDIVEGNLDDAQSIRNVFENAKKDGGIWGVFCVLAFPGLGANADGEEKQGKVSFHVLEDVVSLYLTSGNRH